MAKRDYYDILGVPRSATNEDIKRAYRRLARKYHPDVNKAADAAERFSEVHEAYDVLTDKDKRQKYDYLGHAGLREPGGPPPGGRAGGQRVRWSTGPEGFEEFFQGGGGGGAVDIEDLLGAMGMGAGRRPRQPRRGQDIEYQLTLDFLQAVNGVTTTLEVPKPSANGQFATERIEVRIPPGVQEGSRIRLRGKGGPGTRGGPAGDLYIVLRVLEHPYYRRVGNDIYIDLPITVTEALLGGKVEVPTLDGMTILTVPAGATSGVRLRLKGKGVATGQGRGDEYAVVKIIAPKSLSEKGKELAKQLGQTDPYNPRKGLW